MATAELLEHLALELLAMFTMFFESRRDHDGAAHVGGDALRNHGGYAIGRGNNNGEIDDFRNLFDIAIGFNTKHTGAFVADRVNCAPEGTAEQAPENGTSDTSRTVRCSNDSNAVRREDRVERMAFRAQDIVRLVLCRAVFAHFSCLRRTHGGPV